MASSTLPTPSPVLAEILKISCSFDTEQLHELLRDGGHVGHRQVYLVEDGDDLQVVLHRQV